MKTRKKYSKMTLPAVIPQAWLKRYQELQKAADELSALKGTLRAALEHGAAVEVGAITAKLDVRQSRRLSQKFLFQKLGISMETVKKLKELAPLTQRVYLIVGEHQEPEVTILSHENDFAWLDAAIADPNSPIHDHCDWDEALDTM